MNICIDLLNKKLQYFIKTKQIPNIILHGETGSGYGEYKKTITKSSKKKLHFTFKKHEHRTNVYTKIPCFFSIICQ